MIEEAIATNDWSDVWSKISLEPSLSLAFLKQLSCPWDELRALASEPESGKPYGRKVLSEDQNGEVLLVSWAKNRFTALHDHGIGSGYIIFEKGDYQEELWTLDTNGIKCSNIFKRQGGDVCRIEAGVFHRVKSELGALSLHFYSPTSSGMKLLDPNQRQIITVADDCGAWMPEPSQIVSRQSF